MYRFKETLPQPYHQYKKLYLVWKLKQGDEQAGADLIVNHLRLIIKQCVRLGRQYGKLSHVDDFIGEALEAIVKANIGIAKGKLLKEHDEITWYYIIVINNSIKDYLSRLPIVRVPRSAIRKGIIAGSSKELSHNKTFDQPDYFEEISVIIQDDLDRKIVDLRLQGYVDAEIATLTGESKINVYRRRKELERRYNERLAKRI